MKKKILYLFSDTGGGHRSAAQALIHAVDHLEPKQFEQKMVDVFATCSGFLNVFARLYAPVIQYSPKMWGQLYYWLDDEKKLQALEKISRPFIQKELIKLLKKEKPDLLVSVHPMINRLTVKAIKQSGLKIPFMVVITDPVTLHRAWIAPGVDSCVVATPAAKKNALKYGMPEKKIKVIGMPIDPKFALSKKKKKQSKKFTILIMGGGEGSGNMYELVEEINKQKIKAQLIVIAGRNEKIEQKLKEDAKKFKLPMRVYGFTDKVQELMAESDIIVTKAGPGTIAEALAMNLPIIITSWLPGQEEGNVEFVVKEKIGRVSKEPKKVAALIKEIRDSGEFEELLKNVKRVSRPEAAMDIAKQIFTCL